eukprot:TRINITY_DN16309_c0_g1_i1.p1 TRINITY_DN16309_c0_g1~~TRINITY_DN16309_c0_g1_i1.p1  ORF type:complete len:191 (-),score=41.05 TRINITY_DN16309_c0_g1_i1:4-576(-)
MWHCSDSQIFLFYQMYIVLLLLLIIQCEIVFFSCFFFFFKQKTAYEMQRGLVGSEMCIRDRRKSTWDGLKQGLINKVASQKIKKNYEFFTKLWEMHSKEIQQELKKFSRIFNKEWMGDDTEFIYIKFFSTPCLLYTSDAADDTPCVDLGGRRIIKKKKNKKQLSITIMNVQMQICSFDISKLITSRQLQQ